MSFGPSPDELDHRRHVFEAIDRPRGASTLMTMVQAGFPSEGLRDEHTIGLPNAFGRLERALDDPVHPVALGAGLPLMHGLPEPQRLELISSNTYADGCVAQVFRPT